MERPTIMINGERIRAKNLKFGAYRQIIKLQRDMDDLRKNNEEIDDEEYLNYQRKIIALAMDLSIDTIDDMDIADVLPVFRSVLNYVIEEYTRKIEQLPNGQTPKAENEEKQ